MIELKCLKPGCGYETSYSKEAITHVENGFYAGERDHVMEGENTELGATVTISLTEED